MQRLIWHVKIRWGILQSNFWLAVAKISGSIQRLAIRNGAVIVRKNLELVNLAEQYANELSEIEECLD